MSEWQEMMKKEEWSGNPCPHCGQSVRKRKDACCLKHYGRLMRFEKGFVIYQCDGCGQEYKASKEDNPKSVILAYDFGYEIKTPGKVIEDMHGYLFIFKKEESLNE